MKYLLRWLIGWAYIGEGLVQVLTFGFVRTGFPVWLASVYSRRTWRDSVRKQREETVKS